MIAEEEKSTAQRDSAGLFQKGNTMGCGNPLGTTRVHRSVAFRKMFLDCVTDADFKAVIKVLIKYAKIGDSWAVKEFFDRALGKSVQALEIKGDPEALEGAVKTWGELMTMVGYVELPLPRGVPQPSRKLIEGLTVKTS